MNLNINKYPNIIFAGFWIRFIAYIVDLIIIFSITQIIESILSLPGIKEYNLTFWYIEISLFSIIFPFYFILFTKLSNGQTLGKMIFGLRTICFIEESLSWKTVIIREFFGRYFQNVLLLLYFIAGFTPKKQHLVDILADTSVISEKNIEILNHGKLLVES